MEKYHLFYNLAAQRISYEIRCIHILQKRRLQIRRGNNHFLTDNGINAFLASKELRNIGDTEYRRAISTAMESAYAYI